MPGQGAHSAEWDEIFKAIKAEQIKRGKTTQDAERLAAAAATARVGKSFSASAKITKRDDARHYVGGWASMATKADGSLICDKQQDVILPADLDLAGQGLIAEAGVLGDMHEVQAGRIVEAVTLTAEKRAAMGLPEGACGLWIGAIVEKAETWAKVVDGSLAELSIHGVAKRETIDGDIGRLFDLKLDEVSLVDGGAGDGVRVEMFKLFKRAQPRAGVPMAIEEIQKQFAAMTSEEIKSKLDELLGRLKDPDRMTIQLAIQLAQSDEEEPGEPPEPPVDATGKPAAPKPGVPAGMGKRAMSAEVQKAFNDQQEKIVALEKRNAAIEEERAVEKATARAKAWPHIPASNTDLISVAKSGDPKIIAILDKTEEVLKATAFKVHGFSGGTEQNPADALQTATQEVIKSGRAKTFIEASDIVNREQPNLYAAYVAQRKGAT